VQCSRRMLNTVLDVLHMFVLEGDRQRRDDVMDYLRRATTTRKPVYRSTLRAYDRFKRALHALGIEHDSIAALDGTSLLWIRRPARAKARVEALLDGTSVRAERPKEREAEAG